MLHSYTLYNIIILNYVLKKLDFFFIIPNAKRFGPLLEDDAPGAFDTFLTFDEME